MADLLTRAENETANVHLLEYRAPLWRRIVDRFFPGDVRYLGHTNTAATERYLHYVDAELWAIARELEVESAEVAEVLAEGIHAQTLPAVIEGGK